MKKNMRNHSLFPLEALSTKEPPPMSSRGQEVLLKTHDLIPAYELEATQTLAAAHQEESLHQMNSCCLCGTRLKFLHVTNFSTMMVKERAQCPACGIKTKEEDFTLQ
jgi:hypothetical protein